MLMKSSITNSYNIDAIIQVDAKLYNVISTRLVTSTIIYFVGMTFRLTSS